MENITHSRENWEMLAEDNCWVCTVHFPTGSWETSDQGYFLLQFHLLGVFLFAEGWGSESSFEVNLRNQLVHPPPIWEQHGWAYSLTLRQKEGLQNSWQAGPFLVASPQLTCSGPTRVTAALQALQGGNSMGFGPVLCHSGEPLAGPVL